MVENPLWIYKRCVSTDYDIFSRAKTNTVCQIPSNSSFPIFKAGRYLCKKDMSESSAFQSVELQYNLERAAKKDEI